MEKGRALNYAIQLKMFKMNKKAGADLTRQIIFQIILVGLILGIFFASASLRVNGKAVKQQILEKQLALLIDSAIPETTLIVNKLNEKGKIKSIEIRNGRIFVLVEDSKISNGYPFFTKYNVNAKYEEENGRFLITIK